MNLITHLGRPSLSVSLYHCFPALSQGQVTLRLQTCPGAAPVVGVGTAEHFVVVKRVLQQTGFNAYLLILLIGVSTKV